MTSKFRQEVFNVLLAQLLSERGIITAPERILRIGPEKHIRMPDLIVVYYGLRTAIEGEIGGKYNSKGKALDSARKRVSDGIAHIGIAIIYPKQLQEFEFERLKEEIKKSEFEINIISEYKESGYVKGNIDYLDNILRYTFEQLVQEDIVLQSVAAIDSGIEHFASNVISSKGDIERLAICLGIRELETPKIDREED